MMLGAAKDMMEHGYGLAEARRFYSQPFGGFEPSDSYGSSFPCGAVRLCGEARGANPGRLFCYVLNLIFCPNYESI